MNEQQFGRPGMKRTCCAKAWAIRIFPLTVGQSSTPGKPFPTDQIVQSQGLTALMVTHSMRQALDHGTRTVMLHQGQVVLDVRGAERAALDVPDLLAMFSRVRGEAVDDDKLLLG